MASLERLARTAAEAVRRGGAPTREMTPQERAHLHQVASQLSEPQLQTVWDLIDETHPLQLSGEDEEGAYMDLDLDDLENDVLWVVHAYAYTVTVFASLFASAARWEVVYPS